MIGQDIYEVIIKARKEFAKKEMTDIPNWMLIDPENNVLYQIIIRLENTRSIIISTPVGKLLRYCGKGLEE